MTFVRLSTDPEKITRQARLMLEENIDALLAMSVDNATYLLGVTVPSHRIIRERRVVVMLRPDSPLEVVAVSVEESFLQEAIPGVRVNPYNEHEQTAMEVVADLIVKAGLERATLGLELDFIPALDYEELRRLLPNARFVNAAAIFKASRQVKTAREIEIIRRGAMAAEAAVRSAFSQAQIGMTERQLAFLISQEFIKGGGDRVDLMVVGAGERSSHPNAIPTDRVMKAGEIVRIDVLGTVNGYYTDCARTGVVGEPSEEAEEIYRNLVEVHLEVLGRIRAGVSSRELQTTYNEKAHKLGLSTLRFLGHGLGLGLHEGPLIDDHTNFKLQAGMVLAIEPTHFIPHEVGYHLEDEIVVTDVGYELLTGTEFQKELLRISSDA